MSKHASVRVVVFDRLPADAVFWIHVDRHRISDDDVVAIQSSAEIDPERSDSKTNGVYVDAHMLWWKNRRNQPASLVTMIIRHSAVLVPVGK